MSKVAWVAGASGLVGQQIVEQLIHDTDFSKIIAFVRRPLNIPHFLNDKVEQFPVDFSNLKAPSTKVDTLFCALGSTTKKTPNKEEYYKIDVTYPLEFAKLGLKHKAEYYGLVSAHGANKDSFSTYLQMKGTLETELEKLHFPKLVLARPSLLKGDRGEFRLLEKVSESFLDFLPGNYKAIHAKNVAASLIAAAKKSSEKKRILSSKEMQKPSHIDFPAHYL